MTRKRVFLPSHRCTLTFDLVETLNKLPSALNFALSALNLSFCFLGLWGHQAWNYIPRFLICALAIYKVFFLSYIDVFQKCRSFNYSSEAMKLALRHGNVIGNIDLTIFAMRSIFSYLVFVGCFMAAKRKVSALVTPSQLISKDIEKRGTFVLFLALLISTLLLLCSALLYFKILQENLVIEESCCKTLVATGEAAKFLLHWVSVVTCHIFAVSSLALGRFIHSFLLFS